MMAELHGPVGIIRPRSGVAFELDAGDELTVIDPEGGQVADLLAISRADIREMLSSGRTLDYAERIYLTTGDRLYSNRSNVMLEIVEDTVGRHDFLLTPCSEATFRLCYDNEPPHPGCHGNLAVVLRPYGIEEDAIPVAFNCFMNVPVDGQTGRFTVLPPLSRAGDRIVFRARVDLVIGLTACSAPASNGGRFKPIHYSIRRVTETTSGPDRELSLTESPAPLKGYWTMQRNTEAASETENDVRAENARKSELSQNEGLSPDRYIDEEPNLAAYDFGEAVSHGLTLQPKRIASKWLYDREGSRLFDEIVATPYYYVPRAEVSILKKYGAMISEVVGPGASLVELGSGSSTKVRVLLDALSLRCYIPVEISEAQLREASDAIRRDYPALKVHPIAADYTKDFELPGTVREGRLIGFFPGSTLCNLLPHNSVNFLRRMKTVLGPDSVFLVGVDLKKDRAVMLRAYNDPEGPIWHFNLNILDRMNRELGCNLDKANFRHEAIYNEAEGRMEAAIYSLCHQEVHLDEGSYTLTAGEPIVLEYSHKYHIKEFQDLAREAGWTPLHVWSDQEDLFSVHLLAG